ncbi:MAG: indolepyruvate oxidoreductase subunit beta [Bacteroidales bacterium]|nr:indolepyruvate oxidoreductase subunit beta [Bacteroidales bacterium]
MKQDIILCGVGGQGILSIATVIAQAATAAGLHIKQAEVHGMSQRGGDVQSDLRLSTDEIFSDLIPDGSADLIISMEPMEALRYIPRLNAGGAVVSAAEPLVNIPDYPDQNEILRALSALPHAEVREISRIAREAGNPKGSNMVLLGIASKYIGILPAAALREAITVIFAAKGQDIIDANLRAFDLGAGNGL